MELSQPQYSTFTAPVSRRPSTPAVPEGDILRSQRETALIIGQPNGLIDHIEENGDTGTLRSRTTDELTDETAPLIRRNGSSNGLYRRERRESSVSLSTLPGSMQAAIQGKTFKKTKVILNHIKVGVLFICILACTIIFASVPDMVQDWKQFSVSRNQTATLVVEDGIDKLPVLKLYIRGRLSSLPPNQDTQNISFIIVNDGEKDVETLKFAIKSNEDAQEIVTYELVDFSGEKIGDFHIRIDCTTPWSFPIALSQVLLTKEIENSVIYAVIILVLVYVLIIFELIHRTMAAMLGALAALATLAALNEKPSLDAVLDWLDYETLCLLFGMMTLVAIFCETGFFDWSALQAYKLARGKTWALITILCVFSAVVSAFLDNVTTVLLLTPVTIRLCEVLELDPKHVLMAEVIFSNIGGTATGIGDPPNVIIVSNSDILNAGINFTTFTLHMAVGTVFIALAAYGLLRIMYRRKELLKSKDDPEIAELKHEIEIWRRASLKIAVASREESMVKALLMQKVVVLENIVNKKKYELKRESNKTSFEEYVSDLEKKYKIQDPVLLVKSSVVLITVILLFFVSSFVEQIHISIGWVAILGAIWLLILSDFSDLDSILHRIEWATLLFFAALFILMEALSALGLIDFIAKETTNLIKMIDDQYRLAAAIILILWVSAFASSFIDNIPFTTAMVPVIIQLNADKSLGLPMGPLVWSLAFGACLGGNGTIIGASANVVCAGIAETHGHGFTFWEFFKVGFPMMLVTTFVAMCYLLICHVAFTWPV